MQDANGMTVLHVACMQNDIETATLLCSNEKANLKIQDKYGHTALHLACINGNTLRAQLLLTFKGINLNTQDSEGYTALDRAYWNNYTEIIKLLHNKNARHSWNYYKPHAFGITILTMLLSYFLFTISHNGAIA